MTATDAVSSSATTVTPIRPRRSTPVERSSASRRKAARTAIRPASIILRALAAIGAGFLPIASYVVAHIEALERPAMWGLVIAALLYSAPTLAEWSQSWCGSRIKAWGFTILLEGVMVASTVTALSLAGLAMLVIINAYYAWVSASVTRSGRIPRSK
jgi:hypothetical protein